MQKLQFPLESELVAISAEVITVFVSFCILCSLSLYSRRYVM